MKALHRFSIFVFALLLTTSCAGNSSHPSTDAATHDQPGSLPFVDGQLDLDITDTASGRDGLPDRSQVPDGTGVQDGSGKPDSIGGPDQTQSPGLAGTGHVQSQSSIVLPDGALTQGFWRGDQGWSRAVPMKANGTPDWSKAPAWTGPLGLTGLPGSGSVQSQDDVVLPNGTLAQSFFRGNQGWSRTVPMKANGTPDWSKASPWDGPLDPTQLPGAGAIQSQSSFIMPSGALMQSFFRGDQGWSRTVPMKANGTPDWSKATSWGGPLPLSALPGKGSIQSQDAVMLPNKTLMQGFWRGDQGWSRTVPMKADGTPDWGKASPWDGPLLP